MILAGTIFNRLKNKVDYNYLRLNFDVRYLERWINEYPDLFPLFVLNYDYFIHFNSEKYRYELHRRI